MSQVIQMPEQQYYLTKLLGNEFNIECRSGKNNAAADALSRLCGEHFHLYTTLESAIITNVRISNVTDPKLRCLHQLYSKFELPSNFSVQQGLILYKGRFFLRSGSPLIDSIRHEFHATP